MSLERNVVMEGSLRENRGGRWYPARNWELREDGEMSYLKNRRRIKKSLAETRAGSSTSITSDGGSVSGAQRIRYWLQSGCLVSQLEVIETESRRKRRRIYAFAITWSTPGDELEEEDGQVDDGEEGIMSPPVSPTAIVDRGSSPRGAQTPRDVIAEHTTPTGTGGLKRNTPCGRRQRKTGKSIATMGAAGLALGLGGAAIGVVSFGVGLVPYVMACSVALGGGGALTRRRGKSTNPGVLVLGTTDEANARAWREACLNQIEAANTAMARALHDPSLATPSPDTKSHASSPIPLEALGATLFFRKLCIRKWRGAATRASFAAGRTFIPGAKPAAVLAALLGGGFKPGGPPLDGMVDRIEQIEAGLTHGEDLGLLGCRALAPRATSLGLLLRTFFGWISSLFMAIYFNDQDDMQKSRYLFMRLMWSFWAVGASMARLVMRIAPKLSASRWALTTSHLRPRHFIVRRKWRQLDPRIEGDETVQYIAKNMSSNKSEDCDGYALELTSAPSDNRDNPDRDEDHYWQRLTGSSVKLHDASMDAVFLVRPAGDQGCILDLVLRLDAPKRTGSILARPRLTRGIISAFRDSVAALYVNELVAACLLDLPELMPTTANTQISQTTPSLQALRDRIARAETNVANESDSHTRRELARALASDIALLRRLSDAKQKLSPGIHDDDDSPSPEERNKPLLKLSPPPSDDNWRLIPAALPCDLHGTSSRWTALALEAFLYLTVVALVTFVALHFAA